VVVVLRIAESKDKYTLEALEGKSSVSSREMNYW
jgi:hypothetical protein